MSNEGIYDEFIDSFIPSDEVLEDDELFAQFCDRMGDEEFAAYEASYDDLPF